MERNSKTPEELLESCKGALSQLQRECATQLFEGKTIKRIECLLGDGNTRLIIKGGNFRDLTPGMQSNRDGSEFYDLIDVQGEASSQKILKDGTIVESTPDKEIMFYLQRVASFEFDE